MSDDLKSKVIQIMSVEKKTTQSGKEKWTVKDQDGKTYGVWPLKTDGGITMAYQALRSLPNGGIGSVISIGYVEELIEGYQYPFKTIRSMALSDTQPVTVASTLPQAGQSTPPPLPPPQQEIKHVPVQKNGLSSDDIRRMNRSVMAQVAYKLGKKLDATTIIEIDGWVEYIMTGSLVAANTAKDVMPDPEVGRERDDIPPPENDLP